MEWEISRMPSEIPVSLKTENDWTDWILLVKQIAARVEIWTYIDPDNKSPPDVPPKPVRPEYQPIYDRIIKRIKEKKDQGTLDEKDKEEAECRALTVWKAELDIYRALMSNYHYPMQNLEMAIKASLGEWPMGLVRYKSDVREILITLRNRYGRAR